MKVCPGCDILVGGKRETCPLCQNALSGEGSPNIWPEPEAMRKQALLYRTQLFVMLAAAAVSIMLDFLLDLHGDIHWSLPLAIWLIAIELTIHHQMGSQFLPARTFTQIVFEFTILELLTGWYLGVLVPVAEIAVPVVISVLLLLNFIFSMADKYDNSMGYLLLNIMAGALPYIIYVSRKGKQQVPVAWSVCLILCVVAFIGAAVFKGRKVLLEVQKRMNF